MKKTLLSVAVVGVVTLSGQVVASDLDSVTMELRSQRQLNGSVQELQLPELAKVREALREAKSDPERTAGIKPSPEQLEQLRQLRQKIEAGDVGPGDARRNGLRDKLASLDRGETEERIRQMLLESGVDMDSLRDMRNQLGGPGDLSEIRQQIKAMREQNPELRQSLQDGDFAARIQEAIAARRAENNTGIQEVLAQMKERLQEAAADTQGNRQDLLENLQQQQGSLADLRQQLGQQQGNLADLRNQIEGAGELEQMRAALQELMRAARENRPGN